MERITVSLDAELAAEFDRLIAEKGYRNRSEAVRDLVRGQIEAWRLARDQAPHCVASLSYVYNHHERELAERLTSIQHDHHDLTVATTHAHLDHDHCLECVILRGRTEQVRRFAETIIAERGVRHGKLNLVAVDVEAARGGKGHVHPHGHAYAIGRGHVHFKPAR
jgi:CopG family nickel-responsive transcriptional regulator